MSVTRRGGWRPVGGGCAVQVALQSHPVPVSETPFSSGSHWSQTSVHGTLSSHRESIRAGWGWLGARELDPCSSLSQSSTCESEDLRGPLCGVQYHREDSARSKRGELGGGSASQPWAERMYRPVKTWLRLPTQTGRGSDDISADADAGSSQHRLCNCHHLRERTQAKFGLETLPVSRFRRRSRAQAQEGGNRKIQFSAAGVAPALCLSLDTSIRAACLWAGVANLRGGHGQAPLL